MNYSEEHEEIFEVVQRGERDIVVGAVAGSGKTTTLVGASDLLPSSKATFAAFSKEIATRLSELISNMSVSTLHSIGYKMIRRYLNVRLKTQKDKYTMLAEAHFKERQGRLPIQDDFISEFVELLHFTRVTYTHESHEEALRELVQRYGLIVPDDFLDSVETVLGMGQDLALSRGIIDFDDQLWLPLLWDIKPEKQDHMFIDEAQDICKVALELIQKHRAKDGRMLFVGDRAQAIFGFAGADSQSFDNILKRTGAVQLPLSVCYRCPRSHVQLAQTFVPNIQARADAPEGEIAWRSETELGSLLAKDEGEKLILCRTTAPLLSACLRLIQSGVYARVRGQEIGKNLIGIVQAISKKGGYFGKALQAYEDRQALALATQSGRLDALHDKCAALRTIYETTHAHSTAELQKQIASLFDDHRRPAVWLSTVHKAKGLEADSVYLLRPEKLPLRWDKQQFWEEEQEEHLCYVSITRARQRLVFLRNERMASWEEQHLAETWGELVGS